MFKSYNNIRNFVLVEPLHSIEVGFSWRFTINNSETRWSLLAVGQCRTWFAFIWCLPSQAAVGRARITSSILEVWLPSAYRSGSTWKYCTQRKSCDSPRKPLNQHPMDTNRTAHSNWFTWYQAVNESLMVLQHHFGTLQSPRSFWVRLAQLRAMLQLLKCLTGQTWPFFGWRFHHVTLSWNGSQTRFISFIISFSSANSRSMIRSTFPYKYCIWFAVSASSCRYVNKSNSCHLRMHDLALPLDVLCSISWGFCNRWIADR